MTAERTLLLALKIRYFMKKKDFHNQKDVGNAED